MAAGSVNPPREGAAVPRIHALQNGLTKSCGAAYSVYLGLGICFTLLSTSVCFQSPNLLCLDRGEAFAAVNSPVLGESSCYRSDPWISGQAVKLFTAGCKVPAHIKPSGD